MQGQVAYGLLFDQLTDYNTSDETKVRLSDELQEAIFQALSSDVHALDSVKVPQLHQVRSDDQQVALYTWYYMFSDATAQYGGLLVYHDKVVPLQFNDFPISEKEEYTPENWCGGIYYSVLPVLIKGQKCYTLLAWDGNNGATYKKIIDILSVDRKGNVIFGKPIFVEGRHTQQRVIMEYEATNTLFLAWDEAQNGIVTNVLAVNDERFEDVSVYASATDAFNLFRFEDEKWIQYSNVDLRMDKKAGATLKKNEGVPASGL